MAEIILATVAALIAGGTTGLIAVAVVMVTQDLRRARHNPRMDEAVRAALDETGAWAPYRCGCGEWVWTAADARTVRGERACTYCYLGSEECAEAERERADDLRLHSMLDGGGR